MTTSPNDQIPPASVLPSTYKLLGTLWLVMFVVDVTRGLLYNSLFSWGIASSALLAVGGLLLILSLRRQQVGLASDVALKGALAALSLAGAAMLLDMLR